MGKSLENSAIWVMHSGTAGYLPDSISWFESKADAISAMQSEKASAIDSGDKVYGNARQDCQYTIYSADADNHTLGRTVSIESVAARQYMGNIKDRQFDDKASLVQYLNDHFA